jgi:hypothetical protein
MSVLYVALQLLRVVISGDVNTRLLFYFICRNLPPARPSQVPDDRVDCPHCGRKFAEKTAERLLSDSAVLYWNAICTYMHIYIYTLSNHTLYWLPCLSRHIPACKNMIHNKPGGARPATRALMSPVPRQLNARAMPPGSKKR